MINLVANVAKLQSPLGRGIYSEMLYVSFEMSHIGVWIMI